MQSKSKRQSTLIIERRYADPDDKEAQEIVVKTLLWLLEQPEKDHLQKEAVS